MATAATTTPATTGSPPLTARAGLALVGGTVAAVGALTALVVPLRDQVAWTALAIGLCATAACVRVGTPALLAHPPSSRAARRGWANLHQAAAILLIGLGVRAIDQWWHTPVAQRTSVGLALAALGCLGYLSVRLGMTTRFLRPGREWTPPPADR